eukprot:1007109-Prorocentrum_lima.AAC.1
MRRRLLCPLTGSEDPQLGRERQQEHDHQWEVARRPVSEEPGLEIVCRPEGDDNSWRRGEDKGRERPSMRHTS